MTATGKDGHTGPVKIPNSFDPYFDCCPFCMDELRRGVPEDGNCGHETILEEFPHLRFNAMDRHTADELENSIARYISAAKGEKP